MKKLLVTVALGAMLSVPAVAQEQHHQGHDGRMHKDMTRQQAQQMADEMFQRFDTNHDGALTRAEADAALQLGGRGGRVLDRLFGGAQSITLQQAEAQALAHFDAMDLNHDGTVSAAERDQARAAMRAQQNPGQ